MPFLEELEAEGDGSEPTDQAKQARAQRLAAQADALIREDHWEEAAAALATAVQLAAHPPAAWHVNLANCLCELRCARLRCVRAAAPASRRFPSHLLSFPLF